MVSLKVDKRLGFLPLGNVSGGSVVAGVLTTAAAMGVAIVCPCLGVDGEGGNFKMPRGSSAATGFKANL